MIHNHKILEEQMDEYGLPKRSDPVPDVYDTFNHNLYSVETPTFIAWLATDGETVTAVSESLQCIFKPGMEWYSAVRRIAKQNWDLEQEE